MGRGDRRTRQGKVWRGSYGRTRPRKRKNKPADQQQSNASPAANS